MTIMHANDAAALQDFGRKFWVDRLQPLRGYEGLRQDFVDQLRSDVVTRVDVVEIVAGKDNGCSNEKAVILTMPTPAGSVHGAQLLQAVWAGYMLSLKATMDSGRNPRAHVGDDADAVELATNMVQWVGATATPYDAVYGSDGTYLEALDFEYEPTTRTLRVHPLIGS
jgi:hypothetical protein